mmetsp:Transcript_6991/g.20952  ORF Transcript_6991/g.20952 Transcript_6991/m.20952 type:complete len:521 (-) Transcript_6991:33-1595(-)
MLVFSRFNRLVSTPLLRVGLTLRHRLAGEAKARDNPILDSLLLLPVAQKLVSIEAQEEAARETRRRSEPRRQPTAFDKFVDRAWGRLVEGGIADNGDGDTVASNKRIKNSRDDCVRLAALESYLRPAIVPNERWDDVVRWQHNRRFVRWARSEFLAAKYGQALRVALKEYPELNVAPLQNRIKAKASIRNAFRRVDASSTDRDSTPLPSARLLSKELKMERWSRGKNVDAGWDRMTKITESLGGEMYKLPQSDVRIPIIAPNSDVSSLSLEDLLEVAGGHVYHSGPFNLLCEEGDIYEFWTREYVAGLASYLLDRAEAYEGETLVLDVGAGDGMLVYFLKGFLKKAAQRRLKRKLMGKSHGEHKGHTRSSLKLPKVLATDDGSWEIKTRSKVEMISCKDALAKYAKLGSRKEDKVRCQLIVICSWMPMGEDWTKDMRAGGADEYILIGECDDGTCGDNWETWGNPDFLDDQQTQEKGFSAPPHVLESFYRFDLDDLSKLQHSRFDSSASSNSKTVSFRKK